MGTDDFVMESLLEAFIHETNEMLEALDEKRPRPEVVFLTAYDEFEYAQKAVSLKATEYILKPVTGDELKSLLNKLKKTMDEEAAKREDIELLRSEYEKHLPILRETFISLLINGKLSQDDIEQKIKAYGMETLSGRTFLAGVVMTDGETEDEKAGFDVKEHRELIQFAVYNIANEIMETHHAGITFLYGDTVILISIGDDEESLVPKSLSVFYEIGESIKKYLKFTATIGAGYYCTSIQDIKRSYN
jgi:two-component system response regulator YesN